MAVSTRWSRAKTCWRRPRETVDAYTYAVTLNDSVQPIADIDTTAFRKNPLEDRESLAAVSTSTKLMVARRRLYQRNPEKPKAVPVTAPGGRLCGKTPKIVSSGPIGGD